MVSEGERAALVALGKGMAKLTIGGKQEGDRHTPCCPTVTFKSQQCCSSQAANLAKCEKLAAVVRF